MSSDAPSKLLHARVVTLLDAMPAAHAGNPSSVHQARVASRRLREALPVTSGTAAGVRQAVKQVRRVTRALGPVREIDVALGHLAEFAERGVSSPRAIAGVRRVLEHERQQRRREMLAALSPTRLQKLRRKLEPLEREMLTPEARAAAIIEAERRVQKRAARLAAAVDQAGALYLADRLHAVRVATKKLRYALEIERELRRSRGTARIRQLKSLQDLLGRLHDLEVLIGHTRAAQAAQAATDRRSGAELDRLIRALEDEIRSLHAEYVARRGAIDRLCAALAAAEPPRRRPHAAA